MVAAGHQAEDFLRDLGQGEEESSHGQVIGVVDSGVVGSFCVSPSAGLVGVAVVCEPGIFRPRCRVPDGQGDFPVGRLPAADHLLHPPEVFVGGRQVAQVGQQSGVNGGRQALHREGLQVFPGESLSPFQGPHDRAHQAQSLAAVVILAAAGSRHLS